MDTKEYNANLRKCYDHLEEELSQLRTGRATPELVEGVMVNAYETETPLKGLANITAADTRSLIVQPWDQNLLDAVSKAISSANLGFSPAIEGDLVRVKIPDLTEERRKEFVRIMKEKVEEGRIAVRNVRQKTMKDIDDFISTGMSEEESDRAKEGVEKSVKEMNEKIETLREKKEADLMKV